MRFCSSCGAPAKPGDAFCGQCGSPLGLGPAGTEEVPVQPVPALKKTGTRSRKVFAAGAALVIILLAIATGFILLKGPGNTVTGINKTHPAAETGSYVIVATVETTPAPTVVVTSTPNLTTPATTATPSLTTKPLICASDRLLCNGTCIDPKTDSTHCGTCATTCTNGQTCINGNCMMACSTGQTSCPGGCYNLLTDPDHCGSCLNDCPGGLVCTSGICGPPPTQILTAI
ncbi:MAG TPA: zinc-ribbon domain-containing protein [Methanoregula sp.]|nr:zinc-ribbon domain-containing protein [Methanoregula sp.]